MFIEFPAFVVEGEAPYNVCVNSERCMWFAPMQDGDEDFTRLYMNVAGNNAEPAQLDIATPYDEAVALFTGTDDKGENHD